MIDLAKVEGATLVVKTKEIFELNGGENIKVFVEKLYQDISPSTNPLVSFQLVGIFINIVVADEYYVAILSQIINNEKTYGSLTDSDLQNIKVMLEYSSPNMAKSMTIGHFRNTIIGQIMYNLTQETGCEYLNWNYLGDRGTNFGKFIVVLDYLYKQNPSVINDIFADPTYMMGVIYAKFKEIEFGEWGLDYDYDLVDDELVFKTSPELLNYFITYKRIEKIEKIKERICST